MYMYIVGPSSHGAGIVISRLDLQTPHGCCADTGLVTPREWPGRELGTRFGGLMAYSYTRERLSSSEEVLGRGLGKRDWRKNTQPSMCTIVHPLKPCA
jgi:hypothetical protein